MKQSAVIETILGFLGVSPERAPYACDLVAAVMNEALRAVIDGRLFATTRILNAVLFAAGEVALAAAVLEHTDAIIALRPDPAEAQKLAFPVQIVAGGRLDDEAADRIRSFVENEMPGSSYIRRTIIEDTLDADSLPAAGPGERTEIKKDGAAMRCCLCSEVVRRGPGRFELVLDEKDGPKVSIYWHLGCAEIDQLHLAFADVVRTPSTQESDDQVARAYLAILDRVAGESGAVGLRACVEVHRDLPSRKETMRGAGLNWGRRSPR